VRLSTRNFCRIGAAVLAMVLLVGCAGCPVISNRPAPGRVIEERETEHDRRYRLYIPTRYRSDAQWALVVACHGTPPWDTMDLQFKEWKGLAEEKGFLLVVPELVGTRGDILLSPDEQIRRQKADEQAILDIVRAVKASWSVHSARVFLTGWSAGGYAVLFTGLRNPDVFRALSVRQGNFDPAYVEPCVPFLDRFQPVQIMYGDADLLKDQALESIEWLRGHGMEPTVLERPGTHRREPVPMVEFFKEVIRRRPWVRINVIDDPEEAMRLTFEPHVSFEPQRILWDFGDGTPHVSETRPTHRYAQPGTYTVRMAVWPESGDPHVRQVQLIVPRPRLGAPATVTNEAGPG